jgi:hypothetical protein
MKIEYIPHFWDRFNRRKKESPIPLTLELIEDTVINPDFILSDPNFDHREWRIKKINGRCLRVIVELPSQDDRLIVITVMFDRNLKRKGLCE